MSASADEHWHGSSHALRMPGSRSSSASDMLISIRILVHSHAHTYAYSYIHLPARTHSPSVHSSVCNYVGSRSSTLRGCLALETKIHSPCTMRRLVAQQSALRYIALPAPPCLAKLACNTSMASRTVAFIAHRADACTCDCTCDCPCCCGRR